MEEYKSSRTMAIVALIISALYLLNLSAGVIEIPDNLPVIGNIDEFIFANIFIGSLARLGVDLRPFVKLKKGKKPVNEVKSEVKEEEL